MASNTMNPPNAMRLLPYIKAIEAPDELVESILLEEQLRDLQKKAPTIISRSKFKLDEATAKTTRLLDKHCRKMALILHPDRCGEESRPAFERMSEARNCLRDTELRHLYVGQMMQVVQKAGAQFVESSHEQWVKRNMPDVVPQQATTPQKPKPMLLTGGITNDQPRKPFVSVVSRKARRCQITLPVPRDIYHFYAYCVGIKVLASSGEVEEKVVASLKNVERFAGSKQIPFDVTLPSHGIWHVTWFATLNINDQHVKTPRSMDAVIDLTSNEQRQLQDALKATNELARCRAGDIMAVLRKLRGPIPDRAQVVSRHQMLHSCVSRGRSTLNRLVALSRDNSDSVTPSSLKPLQEALELAAPAKAKLEEALAAQHKRNDLKEFKSLVADMLESGEATSWLETVTVKQLQNMGGEPNRLYQLLVEGSGATYQLELDGATLKVAASRTDLFTPKQCQALMKRQGELERKVEAEAQQALADLQLEKKAVPQDKQDENQAKLGVKEPGKFSYGTKVYIQGLSSALGSVFNGSSGTVELDQGERCIVRCHKDDKLRSFPATSLFKESDNWACAVCTFLHEGAKQHALCCEMCQTPKGTNTMATPEQSLSPKPQPAAAKAVPQEPSSFVGVTHKSVWHKANDKPKAKPVVPATVKINATKNVQKAVTATKSTQKGVARCRDGPDCRFLRQGRDCKFYHPPEDRRHSVKQQLPLSPHLVGWIIGKHGSRLKEIKNESGTEIWIDQESMGPGESCVVHICGSQESVNRAAQLVQETVAKVSPSKELAPEACSTIPSVADTSISGSTLASVTNENLASPSKQLVAQIEEHAEKDLPTVTLQPELPTVVPVQPPIHALSRVAINESMSSITDQASDDPTDVTPLLAFIRAQKSCLKGSPDLFYRWLVDSEDIATLEDLSAAVSDDDYLRNELQHGNGTDGVKGFKRAAFRKAAISAVNSNTGNTDDDNIPTELLCPISHVLMTNDPVLAADGQTYERAAIETWFLTQQLQIDSAFQELTTGSKSERAKSICANGVLSPMTNTTIPSLELRPNNSVRIMARDAAEKQFA